jgi:sugar fermentation stimulation protein A
MPCFYTGKAPDAVFLDRPRRYRLNVRLSGGEQTAAFLANRGRYFELAASGPEIAAAENFLKTVLEERGAYLLIVQIIRPRRVTAGGLGTVRFGAGYTIAGYTIAGYTIYVGSAMRGREQRLKRHRRRRKRNHWHIDYLTTAADEVNGLPVRSGRREERVITAACAAYTGIAVPGVASSDCDRGSHLFFRGEGPPGDPSFQRLLQSFRMPARRHRRMETR